MNNGNLSIFKQVFLILRGNLPKIIRYKYNLMIGRFCYPEFCNNGKKVILRKRLINYPEVNKLSFTHRNLIVSLVSALNEYDYLANTHGYMNLSDLKRYFRMYAGFETCFDNLIQEGFVSPIIKGSVIAYKLTSKAILPRNPALEFVVLD